MLCRPAGRFIPLLVAAALLAGIGAGAIAQPGGASRELTPTAELATNGGLSAPDPSGSGGGAEAPVSAGQPEAPPVPVPAPVEPSPPAETSPLVAPPASDAPELVVEDPLIEPTEDEVTTPAPEAVESLELPAQAEVLERGDEPLVPVGILSAPVGSAAESAPLIDLTPATVSAEPLKQQADLVIAEAAHAAGDDEVVIPVDPDDVPGGDDQVDPGDEGAGQGQEDDTAGDPLGGLPLTGRTIATPLGAGLLLLLLGVALRITAPPSASSRARA